MFDGFTLETIEVAAEVRLRVRVGGHGPAVVLLHGHPRTHTTWHRVAPRLVEAGFRVVCPDLRGYGGSTAPVPRPDHAQASKRAMATDVVALLAHLGAEKFAVVGHDRGAYVAFRLAMDHPALVTRLAVLDAVPIAEALARADAHFAQAWWHWFFFAVPELPERAILSDPDAWYACGDARREAMGAENYADFRRAVHDPAVVRAMLEDYRAGLRVDRAHDDADRVAGRQVQCPSLVTWSTDDDMEELYGNPLDVWRPWTPDLQGGPITSGHHIAEDNPDDLVTMLAEHLAPLRSDEAPARLT